MFVSLFVCMYEAHVKSKFRYKIYLAMNDVTSTSCVSLVRQFETLLFYVSHQQNRGTCCIVSQVLWMPVSKKSTACCCNQLFTVVSTSAVSENVDFQPQSGAQFSVTHSGKIRPDPWWWSVCFRGIFTSICCTRLGVTTLGRPLRLSSCTLSRPLSNYLHQRRTILSPIAPSP